MHTCMTTIPRKRRLTAAAAKGRYRMARTLDLAAPRLPAKAGT